MNCPKCGSKLLSLNEDGDYVCLCGKVIYQNVVAPTKEEKIPIKKENIPIKKIVEVTPLEDFEPGATREQFFDTLKTVCKPMDKAQKSMMESPKLEYALDLLRQDTIKAFSDDFAGRTFRYGKEGEFDAYMEALIERNDLESIAKMLQHWNKYLNTLPLSQAIRGAQVVLKNLASLCSEVNKMRPKEDL